MKKCPEFRRVVNADVRIKMPKISVGETDVLILCGGLGTRFREVREDIPKALSPIQWTTFIRFTAR